MSDRIVSLPEEVVKECLANGRKLKETVNKTITVDVVQWEREDEGKFGRELFYLEAKINPQNDINDEGYVTQAWFRMHWIREIREWDNYKWGLMKPAYFIMPDPLVYFRCYIDGTEARLLPDENLERCP